MINLFKPLAVLTVTAIGLVSGTLYSIRKLFPGKTKINIDFGSLEYPNRFSEIIKSTTPFVEIESKNSLPQIIQNRKSAELKVIGTEDNKIALELSARRATFQSSIFRHCFVIQDYSLDTNSIAPKNQIVALLEHDQVAVYRTEMDLVEVPLHNLTLSTYIPIDEDSINLQAYGEAIGDKIATYENKIFKKMLLSARDKVEVRQKADLGDIYSALIRNKISSDSTIILPLSYSPSIAALDEELKELKLKPKYVFIPDLCLYKNDLSAIILENFSTIAARVVQAGELSVGMVMLDREEVFIQSVIAEGFALSGLTKVIIFRYSEEDTTQETQGEAQ